MAKASDNKFPKVIFTEGTVPATPSAGDQKLYIDSSDHHLKLVNSSGTMVDIQANAAGDVAGPASATDGNVALFDGTSGKLIKDGGAPAIAPAYILVQDQKAQNTAGDSVTAGAWRTMTLNTIVTDDTGVVSLGSNQITLPAGTYYVRGVSGNQGGNRHQARLQDITNTATLLTGTVGFSSSANYYARSLSWILGKIVLAGSTAVEVQQNFEGTATTGLAGNFGVEVYTSIEFIKVA